MTDFAMRLWRVIWRLALMLALWAVLYAPFVLPFFLFWTEHEILIHPLERLYVELIAAVTVFLAVWGMNHFADRGKLTEIGFRRQRCGWDILTGTAAGFLMVALILVACYFSGWVEHNDRAILSASAMLWTAASMFANTMTQEMVVRGYMLNVIRRRFSAKSAIIATSLIFVAMHAGVLSGDDYLPAINLFLIGILLGQAFVLTGSLWLPVGIHFGWNYLQGSVLGLTVTGQDIGDGWHLLNLNGPAACTGGGFGLEGGYICTSLLILGIVAFWFLQQRRTSSTTP